MKKILLIITFILLLGFGIWFFLFYGKNTPTSQIDTGTGAPTGFVPFDRTITNSGTSSTSSPTENTNTGESTSTSSSATPLPVLRQLSSTPIGGYGASTTASTTVVRWVDRGRGNVYETSMNTLNIETISNTLLPRIYTSWWNMNNTTFVGQYLAGNSDKMTTVTANIIPRPTSVPQLDAKNTTGTTTQATSTATTTDTVDKISDTAYELRGKMISGNIIAVTSSPRRDKILVVVNENDHAVGYVSNYDGSKQNQIFVLPFTQLTVEWPEINTIAVTTKASYSYAGYLYFINVKTGEIKQILGDINGLATRVSHDAKRVLYSMTVGTTDFKTMVYTIKDQKSSPIIFRSLAEKCTWSAKFINEVYCGVSSQIPSDLYPDSWYKGDSSFVDSLWLLDADTGDVRQIADLLNQANAIIDLTNIQLSLDDQYLFFMNKNDLSLWSLDLVSEE